MGQSEHKSSHTDRLRSVLLFAEKHGSENPVPERLGAALREIAVIAEADACWWGVLQRNAHTGGWRSEPRLYHVNLRETLEARAKVESIGPEALIDQMVSRINVDACRRDDDWTDAIALGAIVEQSEGLSESMKAAHVHSGLVSVCDCDGDGRTFSLLCAVRGAGKPHFDAFDQAVLQVAHEQVASLLAERPQVALATEPKENGTAAGLDRLTPAQRAVLPYLVAGFTEAEIAKMIYRSRYTVHDHARAIYSALGVRNRVELVHKVGSSLDQSGDFMRGHPGRSGC